MLEKFKEENKRKKQIIIFTCCCIFLIAGVFFYQSFALFETNEQFNVASGSIENPGDIAFAFYINDEIVLEAPRKDSGLALDEKSSCTNGVSVSWNVETWNAKLDYSESKQENTSKVKCNLHFREATFADYVTSCGQNDTSASECMTKYAGLDTVNLAYDETTDNNLRYIGADPNNYVWFNDELWRIIGVMNNVVDNNGQNEAKLKLIKATPYKESMQLSTNSGNWESTTSQIELNTTYYNSLAEISKNMIATCMWNLGAANVDSNFTPLMSYQGERSNWANGRPVTWTGNIAFMYASDYGYATSGGDKDKRTTCLNTAMTVWSSYPYCYLDNWMYNDSGMQWTITQHNIGCTVRAGTFVGACNSYSDYHIATPVLYMKSTVHIVNGIGTQTDPYLLEIS